jgi:hypothetical protein
MAEVGDERRTLATFDVNDCNGEVRFRERFDALSEEKSYDIVDILDVNSDDLDFGVDIRSDEDGVFVTISGYHIEAPDSKRVFHSSIGVVLTLTDIKRLHSFLGFLIDSGLDGITND